MGNRGAGLELRWEYNFVRWVEAQRYNIAYAADQDLQRDPSITRGRRLIVFAGLMYLTKRKVWSKVAH
jgi:hypothetical protein